MSNIPAFAIGCVVGGAATLLLPPLYLLIRKAIIMKRHGICLRYKRPLEPTWVRGTKSYHCLRCGQPEGYHDIQWTGRRLKIWLQ